MEPEQRKLLDIGTLLVTAITRRYRPRFRHSFLLSSQCTMA